LAHQLTRCAYAERLTDWTGILDIAAECDPELARRQYKAIRTSLLCAKARALAHLGKHNAAEAALGTALRTCPRGAVDPLIVLEASNAICASLAGDHTNGSVYFDRALAACRAIGHRAHEKWIDRERRDLLHATRETVAVTPRRLDTTDTALLLGDIATVLGAGHSVDILAHRMAALLQATGIGDRVDVRSESGHEFCPEPSATWEGEADGAVRIRLRGSDRLVSIDVRDVRRLDEISLLKSLADIIQAGISRTRGGEPDDADQTLWPRPEGVDADDVIFRSPRMAELVRVATRLASTTLPILITGETGTGKEVFARLVHEHSKVKRGPFVTFNCSAVARDLVESQLFGHRRGAVTGALDSFPRGGGAAENRTHLLDEVGDLDAGVQPKLLRFLENAEIQPVGDARTQRVPVRVVAATNADVDNLVAHGRFRRDLFYRLGVARLSLPPLRERKDEIPALIALFVARYAAECQRTGLRVGDDLMAALLLYDWPGNIRQLANEIRRIVAMAQDGDLLTSADLAPDITENWRTRDTRTPDDASSVTIRLDQTLAEANEALERAFVAHAMRSANNRVADAAQLLGLSRKGLFLKRRRQGLVQN
jgi:DNA-binding NtrC family response regulator